MFVGGLVRPLPRCVGFLALLGLATACTEQRFQLGFESDLTAPTLGIVKSAGDTLQVENGIKFQLAATDNLGLKSISYVLSGGFSLTADTVFGTAVTTTTWDVTIPLPINTTAGGSIVITATATDGNNNSTTVVDSIFLVNLAALNVTLVRPAPGAITAPGKQITVEVHATQKSGVRLIGYVAAGVVNNADSLGYGLAPDTTFITTLDVPTGTSAGTFNVVGFAVDSAGRRVATTPVTVTVQLTLVDTIGPVVTFSVPKRVEVRDSITVRATDPSGIASIGWVARDTGAAGAVIQTKTTTFSGNLTDVTITQTLDFTSLASTSFPKLVIIKAFATDASTNNNLDSARTDTTKVAPVRADTITVVNGTTRALLAGGHVADAIYNRNLNQVYLTNTDLNRLEVFNVADTSFKTPIPVGSRPWGIALWPRDTLGANADTVVIANSGGTDLSIVDVSAGIQRRRHALPLFRVQTVHSKIDPNSGQVQKEITEYTFSDRPEYVGTVCRGAQTCQPAGTGDVIAVYSTTPTAGQSGQFALRGSVRWENITPGATPALNSHFFWEHAAASFTSDKDTLQIYVKNPSTGVETMLVGALCGRIVNARELAFLDTTFVRNSGNATRSIIGEGGSSAAPPLAYERSIAYDATTGVANNLCGADQEYVDQGIAPALNVRSYIANTAVLVRSVGINFNGLTNMIRADSVYVLDKGLRLKGILAIGGPNFGMDLNFNHDFDPTTGTSPSGLTNADRIAFVASPDPQVDVFDTYYFRKIGTIPIRDPVIGPLRVAKLPSGEQFLIAVTARGVVTVVLPPVTNTFP